MRRIALCLFLVSAALICPRQVSADELSDFESSRRAYERQDYGKAARGFVSLVGGAVPRVTDPVVRLESRKYLGATYLFLGKKAKAQEQFRLLLEEDEKYVLDPLSFPKEVVGVFEKIGTEVRAKKAKQRKARHEREQGQRDEELKELMQKQDRIRHLEELAASETVEQVNSRWLAMLPFGVGQFRNRHRKWGIGLAVTQSAFLVGSIATFFVHSSLRDENPSAANIDEARGNEKALRIGNWVSVGGFAATYLVGVIDAQVRFKPVIRQVRVRDLPDRENVSPVAEREFQLRLGLTGVTAKLTF